MKLSLALSFLACLLISCWAKKRNSSKREFHIDYDRNTFVKDGSPWSYVSGSIHYFRVPRYYWRDRLLRMKAGGLNAIQTYINWNVHEIHQGHFDFTGDKDFEAFLDMANDLDLAVILRIGPYTCGEWDFGGLPWWLNNYKGLKPRTSDPKWIELVGAWWEGLKPRTSDPKWIELVGAWWEVSGTLAGCPGGSTTQGTQAPHQRPQVDRARRRLVGGQWDFGGLPWWLNNYKGLKPRTSDPKWIELVGAWWEVSGTLAGCPGGSTTTRDSSPAPATPSGSSSSAPGGRSVGLWRAALVAQQLQGTQAPHQRPQVDRARRRLVGGQWDFGGLPWWLNNYKGLKPRTSDPKWIELVGAWWEPQSEDLLEVLLPKLVRHLYKNGGPVVLTQIENEYGSRSQACDSIAYKAFLRDTAQRHLGYDAQLITVDGGALYFLRCGTIPTVYPTIDFGPQSPEDVEKAFNAQRAYAPRGPLVNSEFYPGWLDLWGSTYNAGNPAYQVASSMRSFAELNASYNFYMYHGGTNPGYWASSYVTTSYDYGAPLSESGNYSASFALIRGLVKTLTLRDNGPPPPPNPAAAYGTVRMRNKGSVRDLLSELSPAAKWVKARYPKNACEIEHPYGFVLYSTTLPYAGAHLNLSVPGLMDRAQVMQNGALVGTLAAKGIGSRPVRLGVQLARMAAGDVLDLLVENMGRGTDGTVLDPKGILSNVTLGAMTLTGWTHYPLTLENLSSGFTSERSRPEAPQSFIPSIYEGTFTVQRPMDSFLNPLGWGKGQALINGVNVGRYWPSMGPQLTLYVPKGVFKTGTNTVQLFELEGPGNCDSTSCSLRFDAEPTLNATIH